MGQVRSVGALENATAVTWTRERNAAAAVHVAESRVRRVAEARSLAPRAEHDTAE